MASIEQQVEQFAQQIIELHGFRFNEGFSCLIPDKEPFPANEGLFLWGFSQKRMRFETKIEKFHTSTRMKRMEQMLGLSEKDYKKLFSSVEAYLKSLKALGFEEIGKGVTLFGKTKMSNVQADASMFDNHLEALREFELLTLNNPIIEFAEKHGYFEVKNRDQLAWNNAFGDGNTATASKGTGKPTGKTSKGKTSKTTSKSTAKSSTKSTAKSAVMVKEKSTGKSTPPKVTVPLLGEKLKKLADSQQILSVDDKTWVKQVNVLYKDVRGWLSEHSKNGHLTFNSHKIRVPDINGDYDIDSLELDLVGDRQVVFQPVEMNMPGAVGRVDLYHRGYNTRKVMLLLVNVDAKRFQWELWKNLNDKGQTFGKETLEALLTQWLES